MKKIALAAALAALSSGAHALVIHNDVFQVGCTSDAATCTSNGNATFSTAPSWNIFYDGSAGNVLAGVLQIDVEGVDLSENDEVFFNGVSLGNLTHQVFNSGLFTLQLGPGAVPDVTDVVASVFDVTSLVVVGNNVVTVNMDPNNWIAEIETSNLTIRGDGAVPEPGTLALCGAGLLGSGALARRRRRR